MAVLGKEAPSTRLRSEGRIDGYQRIFGAQRCDLSESVFWPLEERTRLA